MSGHLGRLRGCFGGGGGVVGGRLKTFQVSGFRALGVGSRA